MFVIAAFGPGQRPIAAFFAERLHRRQFGGFHHLTEQTIRHDDHQMAVLSARSKANTIRSIASCTDAGANTIG